MSAPCRKVVWENNGKEIDYALIGVGTCDENDLQITIKKKIIEFLTNKPNPVIQKDWSAFGKTGDCIKVLDINEKNDFSNAPCCVSPIEF